MIRTFLVWLAKRFLGLVEFVPMGPISQSAYERIVTANNELADKNEEYAKANAELMARLSNRGVYITSLEKALGYHKVNPPTSGIELGNG